jgi:ribose transport system ATP-binding protein
MGGVALRATGLTRRFGESFAVDGVDLELRRGHVTGLVGENGAGKSTLLNLLSGLLRQDSGEIALPGRGPQPDGYPEAQGLGIARVFQEQALIGNLPVYENLLIGTEARHTRFGQVLNRRSMIALAEQMTQEAGLMIDVRRRTSDLSFSERQLVEIVRAFLGPTWLFGHEVPIVLLDEPTASLERGDEDIFLSLVARLRRTASILFVSHRLGEVLELSDSIVVLKDGQRVAEVTPANVDERGLHRLMVGRVRDRDYYKEDRQRDNMKGRPGLAVRGLTRKGAYHDIDLEIRPGEILGIGGLLESGKSALGKGLAGLDAPESGEVALADGAWRCPRIMELVSQGLGYVPAERLIEGMIATYPLAWNVTLPSGDLFSTRAGIWRHRLEATTSARMIDLLGIRTPGVQAPCTHLSGGNQQKVVLARWLVRDLSVLVLDQPTRGVDAGAKQEIYGLIRDLTDKGVAIVLISDELLELIGLSNRIAIMRQGRIVRVLAAPVSAKPTEQDLVEAMLSDTQCAGVAA